MTVLPDSRMAGESNLALLPHKTTRLQPSSSESTRWIFRGVLTSELRASDAQPAVLEAPDSATPPLLLPPQNCIIVDRCCEKPQ